MSKIFGFILSVSLISSVGFASNLASLEIGSIESICSQVGFQSSALSAKAACYSAGLQAVLKGANLSTTLRLACDAAKGATQGSRQEDVQAWCYTQIVNVISAAR